jgi:hypothetical protein
VDVQEITLDEVAAVESLLRREQDDLPSMFAGPVPETASSVTLNNTQADSRLNAFSGQINSPFIHDADDDETIIITAPYDIFNPADEIQAARQQVKNTVPQDSPPSVDSSAEDHTSKNGNNDASEVAEVASIALTEAMNETVTKRRAGIFRRTLNFLFRRSRQRG